MTVRLLFLAATRSEHVMAAFTLAHLSDPHLPPLPAPRLADLASKRALGYLNWTETDINSTARDVLDTLASDLQTQAPDHVAVTGDFVNLALEAEFAPARTWLESVGTPDRVTIIPGNHDAYVRATAASLCGNICKLPPRRRRLERHVSVSAPARPVGADRRIVGGPDPAADGDGLARAEPA